MIAVQPHQATSDSVERASGEGIARELTIDQCVENVLPVLLHQVVDVPEDATGWQPQSARFLCLQRWLQLAARSAASGAA